MAVRPAVRDPRARAFNMRALWRLGIWGTSAAAALTLAVVAGYSDTGSRRLMAATAAPAATTAQPAARPSETEAETRRLAEAVRALTADRERLAARLGTLERSLEDVTGSIKQQAATAAASPPPAAPPTVPAAAAPASAPPKEAAIMPPAEATAPAQPPAATVPAEPQPSAPDRAVPAESADPAAAESVTTRTEFGVDVGGALNFEGLRVLWGSTKGGNAALFEGLQPVVVVRENSRTKAAELRLIVGPLANAEAAARICATLSAARRYCQPVAYEGQRLAQADVVPERKPAAPRAARRQPPRSASPFH